jgi:hypothetical protein
MMHPELFCDGLPVFPGLPTSANFSYIALVQFCLSVLLSPRTRERAIPPLGAHIRVVIPACSKEQMIWVHTGTDIATMKDALVVWDCSLE